MLFSFTLMGAAIVGLALTPSYARIGGPPRRIVVLSAPAGFALGGEVGPTTAYMAEAAPPLRRGLYIPCSNATQDCAVLMAGLIGTLLAALLNERQLQEWGWRVAMLVGASIVPFGYVRRTLPETLERADAAVPAPRKRPQNERAWPTRGMHSAPGRTNRFKVRAEARATANARLLEGACRRRAALRPSFPGLGQACDAHDSERARCCADQ